MRKDLKIAIINWGKSQRDLGLAADVADSRLSLILHGYKDPTDRERVAICRVLRCAATVFDDYGVADRRADVLGRNVLNAV